MRKHCYASKLNQAYFINSTAVFVITFKEMVDQDKPSEITNDERIKSNNNGKGDIFHDSLAKGCIPYSL